MGRRSTRSTGNATMELLESDEEPDLPVFNLLNDDSDGETHMPVIDLDTK